MSKFARTFVAIPLLVCLAGSPALADDWEPPGKWSLKERQQWSELRGQMLGYLKDANARCGTSIDADFDYESFRGKFKDGEKYGLDAYGQAHVQVPLSAIENICKIGEREKKAVGAGIQRVKFAHGKKGGEAKSTITLRKKVVLPVIEPAGEAAGSWQDAIEAYLKTKL